MIIFYQANKIKMKYGNLCRILKYINPNKMYWSKHKCKYTSIIIKRVNKEMEYKRKQMIIFLLWRSKVYIQCICERCLKPFIWALCGLRLSYSPVQDGVVAAVCSTDFKVAQSALWRQFSRYIAIVVLFVTTEWFLIRMSNI